MKISTVSNTTPESDPPSSAGSGGEVGAQARDEQFIYRFLVPHLVDPTKLAMIEALIQAGHPLSVDDLIPLMPGDEGNGELIRHHANSMVKAGALEVASIQIKAAAEVPSFYFPVAAP